MLNFLKHVEIAFRSSIEQAIYARDPVFFVKKTVVMTAPAKPACHLDAFDKIEDKYLKLRFFTYEKDRANKLKSVCQFASKSAAKYEVS